MKYILRLFISIMALSFMFIPLGSPVISEGSRVPSPSEYKPPTSTSLTQMAQSPITSVTTQQVPVQQFVPVAAPTSISFSFPSSVEFPLDVRKTVLEASNDGYIIGEPIHVIVEVKALADKEPRNIDIYEHAEKNLEIINYTKPYIVSDLNNTFDYPNELKKYYSLNKTSNSFHYNISKLGLKQSILYEFCVIPKSSGTFRTETVTRVGGKGSFFSDEYHPLDIVARNPDFEVRADVNKLEGGPDNNIIISYIIECKDGDKIKNGSRCFNVSVGCLCKDSNIEIHPTNDIIRFEYPHYTDEFYIFTKFHEAGTYSIPELEIGDVGNSSIYLFPDRITITEWWHKYSTEFVLIVTLILAPTIKRFLLLILGKVKSSQYYSKYYNLYYLKLRGRLNDWLSS